MTDREKAIVMAYTGTVMLTGDELGVFYQYVREKLGRCVMTHELAEQETQDAIREAARADFVALCKNGTAEHANNIIYPTAHLMTLEEALQNSNNYKDMPDSVRPVYVQFRDWQYKDESMNPPWRGGVNQRALLKDARRYGIDFVFWTERPLAYQMEDVKWRSATWTTNEE